MRIGKRVEIIGKRLACFVLVRIFSVRIRRLKPESVKDILRVLWVRPQLSDGKPLTHYPWFQGY